MANRPSRLEIQAIAAAPDGFFHGRYPLGNLPTLAGAALSVSSASGALRSSSIALAGAASSASFAAGALSAPSTFKLMGFGLGSYYIGGTQHYDSVYCNLVAPMNVDIQGAYQNAGAFMYGGSWEAMNQYLISLSNPAQRVGSVKYYLMDTAVSGNTNFTGGAIGAYNQCNAFPDFWAWVNAVSKATHALVGGSFPGWATNQTDQCKLLAGQIAEEFFSKYIHDYYWGTTGPSTDRSPSLVGPFHDNLELMAETDYDYNTSGASTSAANTAFLVSFTNGLARGMKWWANNTPFKYIAGNINGWGNGSGLLIRALSKTVNVGMLENLFGQSYSSITFNGWPGFVNQVAAAFANTGAPNVLVFDHDNLSANGTDPYQSTPYAAMRFGFCATQSYGGYYFSNSGYDYTVSHNWFDEYAFSPAGVCYSYSGSAASVLPGRTTAGYRTSAFGSVTGSGAPVTLANGVVYTRWYNPTNGTNWATLVWPPYIAGTVTVTAAMLGVTSFTMLRGTQDATTNNGATVTSVSTSKYDGRVVKVNP